MSEPDLVSLARKWAAEADDKEIDSVESIIPYFMGCAIEWAESKERVIKTLEESRARLLNACQEAGQLILKTQEEVDVATAVASRLNVKSCGGGE